MIKAGEIKQVARKVSVRDIQIEKDYILSWILYGMSKHGRLSKILAFKGGMVLKKVYFERYRYSEDLDFTLLEDGILNEEIFADFREIFNWVRNESNIMLQMAENAEHESGSINFHIAYTGPLGGVGINKRVKVDITRKEVIEFPAILKPVFIHYSDLKGFEMLCYPLEEVLIEKMSDFKEKVRAKINSFKIKWQGSLSGQIRDLPDFDLVARELHKHLRKI